MTLNYVNLLITSQDAGQDASSGTVSVQPTSAVTAAGVTVVSPVPVIRQLSGGAVTISLVACDNSATIPAPGFWAYQITLPGEASPRLVAPAFAGGSSQRLDSLTPVVASTTYGPAATGGVTSVNGHTGTVVLAAADVGADAAGAASAALASAEAYAVAKAGDTMTGPLSPHVVTLADAATILVNAALGNVMRVTLGGNRTMGAPSGGTDGEVITFEITQDSSGSRTLTWNAAYDFGAAGAPALTAAASKMDAIAFRYRSAASAWYCLGSGLGY